MFLIWFSSLSISIRSVFQSLQLVSFAHKFCILLSSSFYLDLLFSFFLWFILLSMNNFKFILNLTNIFPCTCCCHLAADLLLSKLCWTLSHSYINYSLLSLFKERQFLCVPFKMFESYFAVFLLLLLYLQLFFTVQ